MHALPTRRIFWLSSSHRRLRTAPRKNPAPPAGRAATSQVQFIVLSPLNNQGQTSDDFERVPRSTHAAVLVQIGDSQRVWRRPRGIERLCRGKCAVDLTPQDRGTQAHFVRLVRRACDESRVAPTSVPRIWTATLSPGMAPPRSFGHHRCGSSLQERGAPWERSASAAAAQDRTSRRRLQAVSRSAIS